MQNTDELRLSYIVGIAIGDGNLSNSNGRAVRLRITCDTKYPNLINAIVSNVQMLMPDNKVSLVERKNCVDVSCHSNKWEELLGWRARGGSKFKQNVSIPSWIKANKEYSISCLRGLFQTDGSIYFDRGYKMVNFVTIIPPLIEDVEEIVCNLGFKPKVYLIEKNGKIKNTKYTLRISRDVEKFINLINLTKN